MEIDADYKEGARLYLNGLYSKFKDFKAIRWEVGSKHPNWTISYYSGSYNGENYYTIVPDEVVIDIDGKEKDKATVISAHKAIVSRLKELKVNFWSFDSGGTGFHIHEYSIKGLENYPPEVLKEYKTRLIQKQIKGVAGSELVDLKIVKKGASLTGIPFTPHRETGKLKLLVDRNYNKDYNEIDPNLLRQVVKDISNNHNNSNSITASDPVGKTGNKPDNQEERFVDIFSEEADKELKYKEFEYTFSEGVSLVKFKYTREWLIKSDSINGKEVTYWRISGTIDKAPEDFVFYYGAIFPAENVPIKFSKVALRNTRELLRNLKEGEEVYLVMYRKGNNCYKPKLLLYSEYNKILQLGESQIVEIIGDFKRIKERVGREKFYRNNSKEKLVNDILSGKVKTLKRTNCKPFQLGIYLIKQGKSFEEVDYIFSKLEEYKPDEVKKQYTYWTNRIQKSGLLPVLVAV